MKRLSSCFLTCLILLALLPSAALASKARILALGNEAVMPYYVHDPRGIFINPAYINVVKDFVTLEWGRDYKGAENGNGNPKAEGGMVRESEYFTYGLHLGNDENHTNRDDINSTRSEESNYHQLLYQDNSVEFFIGGEMGPQWGAAIKVSQNSDEQTTAGIDKEQEAIKISFGTMSDKFEGHLQVLLKDQSQGGVTNNESFKNKIAYFVGGNYYFTQDLLFYGKLEKDGYEYADSSNSKDIDQTRTKLLLGGGQITSINDDARLIVDLGLHYETITKDYDIASTRQNGNLNSYEVPITIALEGQLYETLTLRGHVKQNVIGQSQDANKHQKTFAHTTEVATGVTITLKKVKIDGMIGTYDSSGNSIPSGTLGTNNLLSRVGLTYWF